MQALQIDRGLQNDGFTSWRLGPDFLAARAAVPLTEPVAVSDTGAVNDYLHTRASVLHNHVQNSAGRLHIFTRPSPTASSSSPAAQPSTSVWQVQPCPGASPPVVLNKLADLAPAALPFGASLAAGECESDCTAAVVETSLLHSTALPGGQYDLLVSCGRGDVRLVRVGPDGSSVVGVSPPVFPIRQPPPLVGVHATHLAAAYLNAEGVLRCVLWIVRPAATGGSADAACEVAVVSFSVDSAGPTAASSPALQLRHVQRLARSALPPHCASSSPAADAVLLGLDPTRLDLASEEAAPDVSPPLPNQSLSAEAPEAPGSSGVAGTGQQHHQEAVEHVECRPPGWRGAAVADDAGDDLDPRTLAEAAARLAQYTSDQPVTSLPPQQWADLYKEAGPEDVAPDVGCEMVVWRADPGGAPTATFSPTEWRLAFGAHKVLSADTPDLLAVTDDVDACVLRIEWGPGGQALVTHVSTIPALAYVASGKTQRKHLLLGQPGIAASSPASAVLVEGTKFSYVYGAIRGKPQHGAQQVVDMQLESGERVLGAALMHGPAWVAPSMPRGAQLLVLTQQRLLVLTLAVPAC